MSTDEEQKRSDRGGSTEEEQHGGEKGDARAAGRELWEGECKFMEAVGEGRLGEGASPHDAAYHHNVVFRHKSPYRSKSPHVASNMLFANGHALTRPRMSTNGALACPHTRHAHVHAT